MNAFSDTTEFRSGVVKPVECLKAGLELVRNQYWLFVGITAVGVIIASAVPFGILMGPMMCGIYLALFKQRRGRVVEFGDLFKGFEYFRDSLVAAMLHIVPIFVIIVSVIVFFYISLFAMIAASGGNPDVGLVLGFFGFWVLIYIVMMLVLILFGILFTFSYALVVERRLSGLDAVKLSARAALANFWGLLGLMLLTALLGIGGVLLCYVGAFLVMPISFGAMATAYEQVFGLAEPRPNVPPPPPSFV
jgi:uncharacterized membrane protein